jgi:error-prone DNA polymerase
VFLCLEDEFGLSDITVFDSMYQQFGRLIYTAPALIVHGKAERRGTGVSVIAHNITPLMFD